MLTLDNVTFGYRPGRPLIQSETLTFEPGKTYGIIGRNGSGKTTLMNLISGLLTGYKGTIQFNGMESKKRSKAFLETFYYIPESPVRSDLKIKAFYQLGPCYPGWDREIFADLLKKNCLEGNMPLKSLSHGWLKRIYFYFGLAVQAKLFLMDEVNDGMDMPAQKELVREMVAHHDPERIVLLASHHMEECQSLLDDILVMDKGKVCYSGPLDEALKLTGWMEASLYNGPGEDLLDRKMILGTEYVLIRHPEQYGKAVKPADLVTFLEAVTMERKEFIHEKK
ncbi:MAG TPA: ABC transporter ATP-binding protein [Firmicutes bacterium]|nr:ABC transporter ATP-binding protein [Bacillota bacterium]